MIIATRDVTRHDPRFTFLIRCPSSIREHRVIPIITCWKTSLKIWISRTYHVYDIDRAPLSRSTPVPFIDTVDKAIAVPNRGRIIDATAPPRVSPVYRINAVERAARVLRVQPEGSLPGLSTVNRRGIHPLTNSDRKDSENPIHQDAGPR